MVLVVGLLGSVVSADADAGGGPDALARLSACVGPAAATDSDFSDVEDRGELKAAIDCLAYYGITVGTGDGTTFSPQAFVSRWQMALFVRRAASAAGVELPDAADAGFDDVGGVGSEAAEAIGVLAAAGIMPGITESAFEPDALVTRRDMAVLLVAFVAAADPGLVRIGDDAQVLVAGAAPQDPFEDLSAETGRHAASIAAVYELGITQGTTATTFSPARRVTRAQMARFITRALGHTNARPRGVSAQLDADTLVVSVRDDDLRPLPDARVGLFWVPARTHSTAIAADGACTPAAGALRQHQTACEITATSPQTDTRGNIRITLPPQHGDTVIWAWTGQHGDTFNINTHQHTQIQTPTQQPQTTGGTSTNPPPSTGGTSTNPRPSTGGTSTNPRPSTTTTQPDIQDPSTLVTSVEYPLEDDPLVTEQQQVQVSNKPAQGKPTITGIPPRAGRVVHVYTDEITDGDGLPWNLRRHAQFQWIRVDDNDEETPIPDATSVFYVPTGDDIGNRIKVRARFRDFGENQESLDSDLTDTVRTWNREARGYLTISGTGQVGETLHVSTAHVSDPDGLDNATFRYEWIFTFRRGEHPNRSIHTSEASYTLTPEDRGAYILVHATFTDDGGNLEVQRVSGGHGPIAEMPDQDPVGEPTVIGTLRVGEMLTMSTDNIADANGLDYAEYVTIWRRINIWTGNFTATVQRDSYTYTITNEDVGHSIRAIVGFYDDDYNWEWVFGTPTETVTTGEPNQAASGRPTITSQMISAEDVDFLRRFVAVIGQRLTVSTAGITDGNGLPNSGITNGTNGNYYWFMVDGSEAGAPVTSSYYYPAESDRGKQIKLRVTFTDDDGHRETVESEAFTIPAS